MYQIFLTYVFTFTKTSDSTYANFEHGYGKDARFGTNDYLGYCGY